MQRVVLDTSGKLVTHLCCHERVGDAVLLEVVVQGDEIQTQFLGHDIDRSAASQRGVHVHHVGVKTVAGIGCHLAVPIEVVHVVVPVAEGHEVAVCQLTTFGYTCRARSIEQDKQLLGLDVHLGSRQCRQCHDVFGQQHLALIFVNDGTQFLVGNQQLGTGVLHHEIEALLGITRVERLVGTTGLEHTQRCDGHPFAAGNEHRHHVFSPQALAGDMGGNVVADFVNLGIGEPLVKIHGGYSIGRGLDLLAEQRYDVLTVVIFQFARVKAVEDSHLACSSDVDVAQVNLRKEALKHSLVALQNLTDEGLGVLIGVVLGLDLALAILDKDLHVEGGI